MALEVDLAIAGRALSRAILRADQSALQAFAHGILDGFGRKSSGRVAGAEQGAQVFDEARAFERVLVEHILRTRTWLERAPGPASRLRVRAWPTPGERLRASEICDLWNAFAGGNWTPNLVGRRLNAHIRSGRLAWLRPARVHSGSRYDLAGNAFIEFLQAFDTSQFDANPQSLKRSV
ncbi:MAG: hypothetical protein AMXMBFR7_25580 [Planctomycetota bacterium]